jgi:hypothetical protein
VGVWQVAEGPASTRYAPLQKGQTEKERPILAKHPIIWVVIRQVKAEIFLRVLPLPSYPCITPQLQFSNYFDVAHPAGRRAVACLDGFLQNSYAGGPRAVA